MAMHLTASSHPPTDGSCQKICESVKLEGGLNQESVRKIQISNFV